MDKGIYLQVCLMAFASLGLIACAVLFRHDEPLGIGIGLLIFAYYSVISLFNFSRMVESKQEVVNKNAR